MITLEVRTAGFSRYQARAAAYRTAPAEACVIEVGAPRRAAPPRATTLATSLVAPLCDGRRVGAPRVAAAEAERGFGLGSGYLTGQIIDRAI